MYGLIILGGGPAGTGPLVWAAQHGKLAWLLERGVAIVERSGKFGGSLDGYVINADSPGTSFLECLDTNWARAAFAPVLTAEPTRKLEAMRQQYPPLQLIADFERCLGEALAPIVADAHGCRLARGDAASVRLMSDGTVAVRLKSGETLAARSVVFGLGGQQDMAAHLAREILPGVRLADAAREKIVPSGHLLKPPGVAEATRILAAAKRRKVVIIGGSHSAFSAAWVLLNTCAGVAFADGDIVIVHRRPQRVFYGTEDEARADGFSYTVRDVCPMTRRVHRMGGLRNDGRELWRRITGRPGAAPETRVRLMPLSSLTPQMLKRLLHDAALVVPALGYRPNTLPVFDASGARVPLAADAGRVAVDRMSRLLRIDGTVLPGLFGVGLGTGFRPWGEMAGEPSFDGHQNSLWLYQNGLGRMVFEGARARLEEEARGVTALVPEMVRTDG
jgi:hypothetical protein